MKNFNWNKFFHLMGAMGSIMAIIATMNKGWTELQWPMIALLWIFVSYTNLRTLEKVENINNDILSDIKKLNEELHKTQMEKFKYEFELTKNKVSNNKQ